MHDLRYRIGQRLVKRDIRQTDSYSPALR